MTWNKAAKELPEALKDVLVIFEDNRYYNVCYMDKHGYFRDYHGHTYPASKVLAWCDIIEYEEME